MVLKMILIAIVYVLVCLMDKAEVLSEKPCYNNVTNKENT